MQTRTPPSACEVDAANAPSITRKLGSASFFRQAPSFHSGTSWPTFPPRKQQDRNLHLLLLLSLLLVFPLSLCFHLSTSPPLFLGAIDRFRLARCGPLRQASSSGRQTCPPSASQDAHPQKFFHLTSPRQPFKATTFPLLASSHSCPPRRHRRCRSRCVAQCDATCLPACPPAPRALLRRRRRHHLRRDRVTPVRVQCTLTQYLSPVSGTPSLPPSVAHYLQSTLTS